MRLRVPAALIVVVCVALVPGLAEAYTAEFKVFYWPTNATLSVSGGVNSGWNAQEFGGDLRLFVSGPWGIHLQYSTGNQGGWSGSFLAFGATSGSDILYSGDLFYEWHLEGVSARLSGGWGRLQSSTTFPGPVTQTITSNGFRVGGDIVVPIPESLFAVQGGIAWYPSNSTNAAVPGFSQSSNAAAFDWSISLQYTAPSGWLIEGGYRGISVDSGSLPAFGCPCTLRSTGVFISTGYRLP